jgi:hypothetical protein
MTTEILNTTNGVTKQLQDLGLMLAVAALTVCLLYPFTATGLDFDHNGVMLKPPLDVWSGQTLHRDTFTRYGVLTTWLHSTGIFRHQHGQHGSAKHCTLSPVASVYHAVFTR